jgi:MFS family permease
MVVTMISVLKNKNFSLILSGKLVSLLGNAIYHISLIWYVLSLPGEQNGKMLTWIMVLGLAPAVTLGGFIGSFVDRYNKKKIIILSDILSGITVLILAYLMNQQLLRSAHLLLATCILSVSTVSLSIAVRSIIPEILNEDALQVANASNQFIERLTSLLGLLFGGILVSFLSVNTIFFINGISFLISAACEMFIQYTPTIRSDSHPSHHSGFKDDFQQIFHFLFQNKDILTLMFVFTFVNLLWDPLFMIVVPYVLKTNFAVTPIEFGAIEAALGLGFCLAAIYFSKRPTFLHQNTVLFYSILGVNTLILLFAVPIMFHSFFSGIKYLSIYFIATLTLAGVFSAALNIAVATHLQKIVPESLRGKFYGVSTSIAQGLIPLSSVIMGSFIGKIDSYLFFAITCALVYIVLLFVPAVSQLTKHLYQIKHHQSRS